MQCLKAIWRILAICSDWTSFDFQFNFFEQSAPKNSNLNVLCSWVLANHPRLNHLKLSRRSVLNFKFSGHNFLWSMICLMNVQQNSEINVRGQNISTPVSPVYVECDKMYRPKVCVQEFLYFVPCLDIQPELSEESVRTTILHAKKLLQVAKHFK